MRLGKLLCFLAVLGALCASCTRLPQGSVAQPEQAAPALKSESAPATDFAAPQPSPAPSRQTLPLEGLVIGLDPGHQAKGNPKKEPIAPGSSQSKAKVTSGTQGRWSGVPEYEVNLQVALRLRELLEAQGATVVMTREQNEVDISNIERAQFFNAQQTDYALRLHCNGAADEAEHGAFAIIPSEGEYQAESESAAKLLIDAFCAETGAENRGVIRVDNQTGFHWCQRMILTVEMGHMSNRQEDALLTDANYQEKMAQGLCNGILQYYQKEE